MYYLALTQVNRKVKLNSVRLFGINSLIWYHSTLLLNTSTSFTSLSGHPDIREKQVLLLLLLKLHNFSFSSFSPPCRLSGNKS